MEKNSKIDERVYHTTNPLVNEKDLNDHHGVSAVIQKDERILTFFHKKYQFWTIPIGKADPRVVGQYPSMRGLKFSMEKELKEELGIETVTLTEIGSFVKTYHRGAGLSTTIYNHLYAIHSYVGEPQNIEIDKHPIMSWMSRQEIEASKFPMSDVTRFYFALQDILQIPSVQLVEYDQ